MKAIDLRPGLGIRIDGRIWIVTIHEHRTPGNLRAFVNMTYKDIQSGKSIQRRFQPSEEVEIAELDRRPLEFLFADGKSATFMDTENFEQYEVSRDVCADILPYLVPNSQLMGLCSEGSPVTFELPPAVELSVTDTPPGIKGATATNRLKEATLETGLKTRVPEFITIGEKIKVSTADGTYLSRA